MSVPFHFCRRWVALAMLSWCSVAVVAAPQTYQVRSGDTIDNVIRQTMGNSPLKIEVLRQAFMQKNPQAFTKTSPRVLMAGAVLTIPDHDELLRQQMPNNKPGYAAIDERKNWVRYP
jgi:Tfp pilus assembly protein FimV